MASAILHIKDTYYFEVPKALWRSNRDEISDFPYFWIRNDEDFQTWEAKRLYSRLDEITSDTPSESELLSEWRRWQHADHANYAKPLDVYLEERTRELREQWLERRDDLEDRARQQWEDFREASPANADVAYADFLKEQDVENPDVAFAEYLQEKNADVAWFAKEFADVESAKAGDPSFGKAWALAKAEAGGGEAVKKYSQTQKWSADKIEEYNSLLNGKILIPQPFGRLRNLYQPESGVTISKFMLVEVAVAVILVVVFTNLAKRMRSGEPPKGRFWNLLESFLLFIRDEIAKPTMGAKDANKYTPLLWTIFMFVLTCNLMGLIPWVGTTTGAFSVTLSLAAFTMGVGIYFGTKKFGVVGFWLNLIPSMDLPWWIGPIIKPVMFAIELLGFLIKHGVLAIRLLANMVAGHLVLLAIMGLAFSAEGAMNPNWHLTAVISVLGSTVFSCLELFVAFLQAYLFTFLSSLFIAAATHHH